MPAVLQRRASGGIDTVFGRPAKPMQAATVTPRANTTGLPDRLKSGVEQLSGLGMDDVRVHFNSPRPAQLQALAYTQGADIHVAPGQERHVPHEAWHVVQQKQGRVKATRQTKGVSINDDAGLEREADAMGPRAAQTEHAGVKAEPSVPLQATAIQRKPTSKQANTKTVTLLVGDTGAYSYVINGTATQRKNDIPAQGNIRYIRTDGVADCIAVAMQGTRADGTVVSLLAHLSGKEYLVEERRGLEAHPQTTEAYWQVANFAQGLNNVRSIAVTTYQRPPFDIVAALKPGVQGVPLHNVDPFTRQRTGDFILDTEEFALHKAGPVDELRGAELGGSVSDAMTQLAFQRMYPPPKQAADRLPILLKYLALVLFIALVWKVVSNFSSSSEAPPQPEGPPGG
jgi:hypothetical protein